MGRNHKNYLENTYFCISSILSVRRRKIQENGAECKINKMYNSLFWMDDHKHLYQVTLEVYNKK